MMGFPHIFTAFIVFIAAPSMAQHDKLINLDGDTFLVKLVEINDYNVRFKKVRKNGSLSGIKSVRKEYFYSVVRSGKEEYIYKQDTLLDHGFTTKQMLWYIRGAQDAHRNFDPALTGSVGEFFGGFSSLFLGDVWGLAPPAFYLALLGRSSPNKKRLKVTRKGDRDNEFFVLGYQKVARGKRVGRAALGSLMGYIAGVVVRYRIYQD